MVMGNLAERYELSSLKSAGIPLLRVMKPLMFLTFFISIFSFFCSNNFIPVANLQFKSRLYDIRKQKPTLSLESGVFNEDFKDLVIHIGKKGADNRQIEDIIIYDHMSNNKSPIQVLAKKGEMYTTKDGNYFVMNLFNGNQYQETDQVSKGREKTYPFIRTSFKEWTKVFDLGQFQINETDTELFKSHHSMLTMRQLFAAIDTLDKKVEDRLAKLDTHTKQYFKIFWNDSLKVENSGSKILNQKPDPAKKITVSKDTAQIKPANKKNPNKVNHQKSKSLVNKKPMVQTISKPLSEYQSITEIFPKKELKKNIYSKAKTYVRNLQSQALTASRNILKIRESRVKHIYELNIKFSMAFVCFIFLFIGAPMGAIVRKGGFGYPLIIAIIFFMIFIILNIFCKKLAETFVLPAYVASWMPCAILFPIGLILTYRAMNDSKIINTDRFQKIFQFFARILKP